MSEALQQEIRHLRTLEGSPRDPRDRIFLPLADAHLRMGHLSRARELLEDGLTRHPDFVGGHVLMARLLEAEGDMLEAEERWATARRLDPRNAEVLLSLGRILVGRGESLGGELVLQAREMDPTAGGQEPDEDLVAISDLAPESSFTHGPPVVSIADLAPDAAADVVSIADLAPTGIVPTTSVAAEPTDVSEASETSEATEATDAAEVEEDVASGPDTEAPEPHTSTPDVRPDRRVVTRTLAELFVGQGQRERAVEMYEELLERAPHDRTLHDRLAELRSDEWDVEADAGPADDPSGTGADADEEEFDPRLSPAAPEPDVSTPFAWTTSGDVDDDEAPPPASPEESGEDRSISDYLGGLLGYSSGRPSDDPSRS